MGICGNKDTKSNLMRSCKSFNSIESQYLDLFFKNMPEIEGKTKGEGIKRMKAYKCNLPIDQLNKLRDEFWSTMILNDSKWRYIKHACAMDHIRAYNILNTHGLRTTNGCIDSLIDKKGKMYKIPNFCVNDPYFEKVISKEGKWLKHTEDTKIKLTLYNLYLNKSTVIEVYDNLSGKQLKELYFKTINLDPIKIRLFFGGAEILDDHLLYNHKIRNGYTIQVLQCNNN